MFRAMSRVQAGIRPAASTFWDYEGFIELAKYMKRNRTAEEQREAAHAVLRDLMPKPLMIFFGAIFRADPRASSMFAAWGSSIVSGFLVGPR